MWWVLVLIVDVASGYSTGAAQCDARTFPAAGMGGTLSNTGWSVKVNPSGFTKSTPISITIAGPTGTAFRGIQMYVEDSTTAKYGSWAAKTGYQASSVCSPDPAFTHSSSDNKPVPVTFTWTSPATDPGVGSLTVRALLLTTGTPSPRVWATVSATLANMNQAPSPAPVTHAPTPAPTNVPSGAPTLATGTPTTRTPTTPAPTFSGCEDGLQGPTEIGIDCGGPCPACPSYVWKPQDWTPCSLPCGGGIQTRSVKCVDGVTGVEVSSANCTMTHAAETSIGCNPDPCPSYSWNIGEWQACSSPCGGGTQVRSVSCLSDVGNVTVNDTYCGSVAKPSGLEDCNIEPCAQARWVTLPWNTCSVTCGGGIQSRTVQCQDATDKVILDDTCVALTAKPVTQQACNTDSCSIYIWNPCPDFYPCTATCNGGSGMLGVRYKDVFCVELSTLNTVDESLCDVSNKPRTNYSSCNPQPCDGFNWMANGNWGPCEKSQVAPFNYIRTRTFHCHTPLGAVALYEQCASVPQPVGVLDCTPNTCLKIADAISSAELARGSCVIMSLALLWSQLS